MEGEGMNGSFKKCGLGFSIVEAEFPHGRRGEGEIVFE